jgi:predicted nucleic acid-binding protein
MDYLAIDVTHEFIEAAIDLALRYNLRAYDAAQLASALTVRNVVSQTPEYAGFTLISADLELNRAAALEGLQVENPNTH